MDSTREIVNSNLVEAQPNDPHQRGRMATLDLFAEEWQIQELRRFASQIRQLGQKFSAVMIQPEQSLNVLREAVDDHLPWQAGRHLCELFDYGLLDGTEIAGKRKFCELRVLSPVWREKEIERLTTRAMGAGRLGGMNQEPPDPEYIKFLQEYHKLCESVPAGKPADIDSLIVRATWWRFILRELTRSEDYKTRLGTKVEQNFGTNVGMLEYWARDYSVAPLDPSPPFSGDSTEERLRLRLHTAARIQTVACEIVAELLESEASARSSWITIESEELHRQAKNNSESGSGVVQSTERAPLPVEQQVDAGTPKLVDPNERSITADGETDGVNDGKTPATQSTVEHRKRKKTTRRKPKREWPTEPTDNYEHGPVKGSINQFTEWLELSDEALYENNGKGSYMVCKEHRTLYRCWFKESKRYSEVNAKSLAAEDSKPVNAG